MPDSIRQRLVSAGVTRMASIDGTGVYETDVEGRVADSETGWAEDQGHLPAISVFDGDAIATPTSTGEAKGVFHEMPIIFAGFVKRGTTAVETRKLMKDILAAIRVDDKWGGVAMQSRPVRESIVRNKETFEVEGCEVEIAVFYKTSKFNGEA